MDPLVPAIGFAVSAAILIAAVYLVWRAS